MKQGMLIIISGPSGSGKGTVVNALAPISDFALSISVTTRKQREGEIDGKHYFFRTTEEFERMRANNELLEHASFCGNYYGTPRFYVEEQIALGKTVVLEIEVNGALQVKEKYPDCVLIFLMPPTVEELHSRLTKRGTEDPETIERRLIRAHDEIKLIDQYDYLVINETVEKSIAEIEFIVEAESLRPKRCACHIRKFKGEISNA